MNIYPIGAIWCGLISHHKQDTSKKGKRPALVLSPKIYNEKSSLCIILPITSKIKGYPFEVSLPKGLEIDGVILSDQIKNLDYRAREIIFISKLPDSTLGLVQKNVMALVW